jgi:hypothetical protein
MSMSMSMNMLAQTQRAAALTAAYGGTIYF